MGQHNLGLAYLNGTGMTLEFENTLEESNRWNTGIKLLLASALQGNAPAQYNLATNYEEGHGVAKDLLVAYAWYKISAENGDEGAIAVVQEQQWQNLLTPANIAIIEGHMRKLRESIVPYPSHVFGK